MQLWGFGASTLQYNITQAQPYQKSTPHLKRYINVRVHPYAHPQHFKVLNHFVYMTWIGDAVSRGLEPLNHDLTTSLRLSHSPNFPKIHPSPPDVYQHKGAPICPSTASQGAKTLCIYMLWLKDAVSGGLEPQP
jgi:hypothetical protein